MAKCRQWSRLQGPQRNTGPAVTAGPVPLITPKCCTHRRVVKWVQANACPCRAANRPCTNDCPSKTCRNRGHTWVPTAPRLTDNMRRHIEEAQEVAPTLCHAIPPVVLHQYVTSFSPSVLPRGDKWPTLSVRANTSHVAWALTKTTAHDLAAPAAVRSVKWNSNPNDQRTVKLHSPVRPLIKKVMSRWWQALERETATQIMSNWQKTHSRAWPTRRTSRDTSVNWNKSRRSQKASSSNLHNQRFFST